MWRTAVSPLVVTNHDGPYGDDRAVGHNRVIALERCGLHLRVTPRRDLHLHLYQGVAVSSTRW